MAPVTHPPVDAGPPAGAWTGSAVLAPGLILYAGPGGGAVADHAHHALQMMWALDGVLELQVGANTVRTSPALVPPGARHGVRAVTGPVVLALVEPTGLRGRVLARQARLAGSGGLVSAGPVRPPDGDLGPAALTAWLDGVIAELGWREDPQVPCRYVQQALDYVDATIERMPRLAEAAEAAHVSPSTPSTASTSPDCAAGCSATASAR